MIRNIISAAILLAALISIASVAQVANAVDLDLNVDVSTFGHSDGTEFNHPYSWTPNVSKQEKIIRLYEHIIFQNGVSTTGFAGDGYPVAGEQRLLSFEIYQGDGLNDLREQSSHHNRITLPDEDTEAYGVSVKQRF